MIEGGEPPADPIIAGRNATDRSPFLRPGTSWLARAVSSHLAHNPRSPLENSPPTPEGQRCLQHHSPDASSSSPRRPHLQRLAAGRLRRRRRGRRRPAQSSASTVPQADIDKAMDTETTLTFWTWVPDIKNEVKLFTTKYPKIKVNAGQRRPGRPALPEAADRDPVRAGRAGRGPGGVPVHQLLHPRRRQPARPHPVRAGDAEGQLRRTGSGPRSTRTADCGASRRTPARWACCTARTCSAPPASRRRRPTTTSPPRPRPTTPRTRRATWSTWRPTSPVRSWPTCGRPASARSRSTASRRSRSTWPTTRPRRWSSSGATW